MHVYMFNVFTQCLCSSNLTHHRVHLPPSPSHPSPSLPLPHQLLEIERDRAEDRLKIEQTQRDSIEKLRQRNKELEEQLRELCESQVRLQ